MPRIRKIICCAVALGFCLAAAAAANGASGASNSNPTVISNTGGKLNVDGKPSFLIMYSVPRACPTRELIEAVLAMGTEVFNTYSTGCGSLEAPDGKTAYIHGLLYNRALWWSEVTTGVEALPELVSWQASLRSVGTGRLGPGNTEFITSGCQSTEQLWLNTRAAANVPTQHWISLSRESRGAGNVPYITCTTPRSLQAEVMTFVAAGGDTIMYIAHGVKLNANGQMDDDFDVTTEVQVAARNLASVLKMMEPVITQGDPVRVTFPVRSPVKATGWRYRGSLYVLAVNTKDSAAASQLRLSQPAGRAVVVGEGRSIKITKKVITERFPGFGWRLYRVG